MPRLEAKEVMIGMISRDCTMQRPRTMSNYSRDTTAKEGKSKDLIWIAKMLMRYGTVGIAHITAWM